MIRPIGLSKTLESELPLGTMSPMDYNWTQCQHNSRDQCPRWSKHRGNYSPSWAQSPSKAQWPNNVFKKHLENGHSQPDTRAAGLRKPEVLAQQLQDADEREVLEDAAQPDTPRAPGFRSTSKRSKCLSRKFLGLAGPEVFPRDLEGLPEICSEGSASE